MYYKEALNLIKMVAQDYYNLIIKNPNIIFNDEKQKLKKNEICEKLCIKINKKLYNPWISKEELNKLYKIKNIETYKTLCAKNIYYSFELNNEEIKIRSTISQKGYFFDENEKLNLVLNLNYDGDINFGKYNPNIIIVMDILPIIIMHKLCNDDVNTRNFVLKNTTYAIPNLNECVIINLNNNEVNNLE